MKLIARKVTSGVPIWDLFEVVGSSEVDIGLLTDFPGEGPTATVRVVGLDPVTVACSTLNATLESARYAYERLMSEADAAEGDAAYGEIDEDRAYAEMLERRAEMGSEAFLEPPYC